jgi:hypothetical protein
MEYPNMFFCFLVWVEFPGGAGDCQSDHFRVCGCLTLIRIGF